MRILVVGAGAVGGYFGGRLRQLGRDVTFLVRPLRAAKLRETGLQIVSPFGDVNLPAPTVLESELREPFDYVLLSCKAYDLENAIRSFAPAVGPGTTIVPMLNGLRHLETLDEAFGAGRVLGGRVFISAKLDDAGRIIHFNDRAQLAFGERDGSKSERVAALAKACEGALFESKASDSIMQDMWEKWTFLATFAGSTCLFRSAVGDVVRAGGADVMLAMLDECRAVAAAAGHAMSEAYLQMTREHLTDPESPLTSSMLGDVERGFRAEADHILGDMLRRRREVSMPDRSLLRLAYLHLKAYEERQTREELAS